jgi:hypothetical protein
MNIDLTEKEREAFDKFIENLPQKYKYEKVKLIFTYSSGIGRGVSVKVKKLKKDITDYDSW